MSKSTHSDIAAQILELKENIVLIYAFNATGKTRLSVEYKNETKDGKGNHAGVYYNAFSEDLFVWNNDSENNEEDIRIELKESSLNNFHDLLKKDEIFQKLKAYKVPYDFDLIKYEDSDGKNIKGGIGAERGIKSMIFYLQGDESKTPIKISRGEERIFVWCFYLALFEVAEWADEQDAHFFIDDPVSSLDDHNIFITATTIFDLIEEHFKTRKIIITTHHVGLFSILNNFLYRGDKKAKFTKTVCDGNSKKPKEVKHAISFILSNQDGELKLSSKNKEPLLYHLQIIKMLKKAQDAEKIEAYHFVLLRQVLESISSFLGSPRFSYALDQIDLKENTANQMADIINHLSHKNLFSYEMDNSFPVYEEAFNDILDGLIGKYNFKLK